ncbi:MAG: hypothetical protein KDD52_04970 [Bdellovibrionales bacterium]|nr:hypothetical protein [Bdellovibrionales bacterium]
MDQQCQSSSSGTKFTYQYPFRIIVNHKYTDDKGNPYIYVLHKKEPEKYYFGGQPVGKISITNNSYIDFFGASSSNYYEILLQDKKNILQKMENHVSALQEEIDRINIKLTNLQHEVEDKID